MAAVACVRPAGLPALRWLSVGRGRSPLRPLSRSSVRSFKEGRLAPFPPDSGGSRQAAGGALAAASSLLSAQQQCVRVSFLECVNRPLSQWAEPRRTAPAPSPSPLPAQAPPSASPAQVLALRKTVCVSGPGLWMAGKLTPAVPAVETFSDLAFGDIFLHLLTGNLALLADEFALDDFCSSLFEGFLLTASPRYPGWGRGACAGGGALAWSGRGPQPSPPLPGRKTCSGTRCGCCCICTTAWPRPGCRPCRRRWSPPARWVPPRPHPAASCVRAGSPCVDPLRACARPDPPRACFAERRGGEGALFSARREAGAARPSEAQPGPGRGDPGPRAAAAHRSRPRWALTLPLELLGRGGEAPWT